MRGWRSRLQNSFENLARRSTSNCGSCERLRNIQRRALATLAKQTIGPSARIGSEGRQLRCRGNARCSPTWSAQQQLTGTKGCLSAFRSRQPSSVAGCASHGARGPGRSEHPSRRAGGHIDALSRDRLAECGSGRANRQLPLAVSGATLPAPLGSDPLASDLRLSPKSRREADRSGCRMSRKLSACDQLPIRIRYRGQSPSALTA